MHSIIYMYKYMYMLYMYNHRPTSINPFPHKDSLQMNLPSYRTSKESSCYGVDFNKEKRQEFIFPISIAHCKDGLTHLFI